MGKECRVFSYPNGGLEDFTHRDKSLLKQLGYTCAFTQISGFNTSRTDVFELKRFNIGRGHDFTAFVATVGGAVMFLKWLVKN